MYHDKDAEDCGACVEAPCRCDCGGFLHIQIAGNELDAGERLCDSCGGYSCFPLEGEEV